MTDPSPTLMDRPSDKEVRFARLLDAPRELVWAAWTDPAQIVQWWGPTGFTDTTHHFDFRKDGEWRHTMHGPDGTDYPNRVIFREIVPPSLLVYENGWDLPGAPLDFKAVITLQAEGNKTRLSMLLSFYDAEAFRVAVETYGAIEGGMQHLARLAEHLVIAQERLVRPVDTSAREIVAVRVVKAPRELVWDAWTVPERWRQWWGPDGFTTTIKEMNVRAGGRWEFTMHGPDGTDYRNESRYLEVIRPLFLSYVHHSTPKFQANVSFEAMGDTTKVTLQMIFDTPSDHRMAVETFHAVEGARQTLAKLAALLER